MKHSPAPTSKAIVVSVFDDMKRMVPVCILLIISTLTSAQTPDWAWGVQVHGTQIDLIDFVDADRSGNVVIGGNFSSPGLVIEDTMLQNEPEYWPYDQYVALLNADGSLQWAKRFHTIWQDESQTVSLYSVVFDAKGDVCVLGKAQFGTMLVNTTELGLEDEGTFYFLIEFSSTGSLKWYTLFDNSIQGIGLVSDEQGGLYFAGYINSWCPYLDFGGVALVNDQGKTMPFITHFNTFHQADWTKPFDAYTSDFQIHGNDLGDVFFSGSFGLSQYVIDDILLETSNDIYDEFFIGRCNRLGEVEWASVLCPQEESFCKVMPYKKELYVLGYFEDDIALFGNDTLVNTNDYQTFLSHLDADGHFISTHAIPGNPECEDFTMSISPLGQIYLGAYISDTLIAGEDTLTVSQPNYDPLVTVYDELPEPVSGFTLPMTDYGKLPEVFWDAFGNVILKGGFFEDTLVFDVDSLINLQLSRQPDYFIATAENCLPEQFTILTTEQGLIAPDASEYQWYLNDAIIEGADGSTFLPTLAGTYTLRIQLENGCFAWSAPFNWGIGASTEDIAVYVFPNPSSELVHVYVPEFVDFCTIYDAIGNKVVQWESMQEINAVVNLSMSGMYFAEVRWKDKSACVKFIIQ